LHAHEIARTSALQAAELHDRLHVASQELELAQQRLQRLQLQLQLLAVDLDVVLILKQGQIEVEESPVVTDMSDAILVTRPQIQSQNERILHQGAVMVSLLRDTMKLQSGIQRFRWDAEELDMREEDVTSRIRHYQLLRVTKDLQLRISGAETKSNSDNVTSLEKQLGNMHEVHQGRQLQLLGARSCLIHFVCSQNCSGEEKTRKIGYDIQRFPARKRRAGRGYSRT
jgi:hypothetical protein